MAFAAARMIMPKDKQPRKASAELPANSKNRVSFLLVVSAIEIVATHT